MEEQLEHKIKTAYEAIDTKATYTGQNVLWAGIAASLGHASRVAPFWKVAAIILALITFGGVFASVNVFQIQKKNLDAIQLESNKLEMLIDSLENLQPEIRIKTELVEKEKIVYKKITVPAEKDNAEIMKLEMEVQYLNRQIKLLTHVEKNLRDSLLLANNEINKKDLPVSKTERQTKNTGKFQLKTEKFEEQIQPNKPELTPKIKIQLFNSRNSTKSFDSNTTLFKK